MHRRRYTTDKLGNTIKKADAKRLAEEEGRRAAAKAKREAKAEAAAPPVAAVDDGRPSWLADYDKVKAKAAAGGKLSSKEKKLLKRGEAREAEDAALGRRGNRTSRRLRDARCLRGAERGDAAGRDAEIPRARPN